MNAKKFIDTNVLIYAHDAVPAQRFRQRLRDLSDYVSLELKE
jgi:predicted nucleic acid-binding protein